MSEVRKWLETIGLGQYGDAFETNDIDMDLLRQIDDQALRDLGMTSAGHQRDPVSFATSRCDAWAPPLF